LKCRPLTISVYEDAHADETGGLWIMFYIQAKPRFYGKLRPLQPLLLHNLCQAIA